MGGSSVATAETSIKRAIRADAGDLSHDLPNPLRNPRPSHDRLAATYSMVHVMSEVIRFDPVGTIEGFEESEFGQYCFASDLDAQRLRADTAEAELKNVRKSRADELENYNALISDHAAAEQRIAHALQLLAETSKAILHHQANQPMSHRLEGLLTKARAKVDRYLKCASLNQKFEGESK